LPSSTYSHPSQSGKGFATKLERERERRDKKCLVKERDRERNTKRKLIKKSNNNKTEEKRERYA
jgi:hypothetical protein